MPRSSIKNTEKVTISLPRNLVEFADRTAQARRTSRSQIIAEVLAKAETEERNSLAAEGYRFYAEESRAFAEASLPAVSVALSKDS